MNRHTVASYLRPALHVLLTPQAAVLEVGAAVRPIVRRSTPAVQRIELQFEAAVADLMVLLDNANIHGRRVHAWVSDYWARPLLLPMQGALPAEAEVDILLQTQYRRIYGDMMAAWRWCWAWQAAQLTAVAWPESGLAALQAGLAQRHCVLATAQPLSIDIAAKANPLAHTGWVALLESQSFTLLYQHSGQWQTWSVTRSTEALETVLPLQLARLFACSAGTPQSITLINTAGLPSLDVLKQALSEAGWATRQWQPPHGNAVPAYRLSQAAHARGAL